MIYIDYFNLKDGVSEEAFVSKSKELLDYLEGRIEGYGRGRLYRHNYFGANPRTYQMHTEVKDFSALDTLAAFVKKDSKAAKLLLEWQSLIDMNTHFDEFVREVPLG